MSIYDTCVLFLVNDVHFMIYFILLNRFAQSRFRPQQLSTMIYARVFRIIMPISFVSSVPCIFLLAILMINKSATYIAPEMMRMIVLRHNYFESFTFPIRFSQYVRLVVDSTLFRTLRIRHYLSKMRNIFYL